MSNVQPQCCTITTSNVQHLCCAILHRWRSNVEPQCCTTATSNVQPQCRTTATWYVQLIIIVRCVLYHGKDALTVEWQFNWRSFDKSPRGRRITRQPCDSDRLQYELVVFYIHSRTTHACCRKTCPHGRKSTEYTLPSATSVTSDHTLFFDTADDLPNTQPDILSQVFLALRQAVFCVATSF